MSDVFIELKNIEKHFSGVRALDGVSLTLRKGEIHCLAGENGSGKSTIIKVMSGIYTPDAGEIFIDGEPISQLTPIMAIRKGIQVIYQDFSLFGNLTVAENLTMNVSLRENRKLVNWRRSRELARQVLERLNVDIDLDAEVSSLPTSGKQLVAIARALLSDARLIIMDEPTTALTSKEVETLFRIVKDIQARGITVLFVSHKMREMLEISEHITILRNGKKVAEGEAKDFDEFAIIRHMTGQDVHFEGYQWQHQEGVQPRLKVEKLCLPGYLDNVDLEIGPGEIVGLSGLLGSGRTALALSLFGMVPNISGNVFIDGKKADLGSIQKAIAEGIAYVPEDRLTEGLFLTQSINRNILATSYEELAKNIVIDQNKAAGWTEDMIKTLQIATPTGEKIVGQLSGGNQQRVVLSRWFLTGAKVLILNGPTVGVDIGSKAEIHKKIRELAVNNGLAVLMISDDVLELVQNCNRIILMHKGQFVDCFQTEETSEDHINDKLKELQ
ncbi:sugar ABC transporter ATP-binding protein [Microvirga sp. W0021]|uniref:Sugar ABC transporter ATP-binding protein n=1 Tax=Hohaiivirga grylli TaxID=3133970 RepID=A0ABV0BJ93_9HYPH